MLSSCAPTHLPPPPIPPTRRDFPSVPAFIPRLQRAAVSARDRRILALALGKLGGAQAGFDEAVRALRAAVEEQIPAGRIYLLGSTEHGPIVGSIVSGVGLVASPDGALLVRVERDGGQTLFGSFSP